jgi:hypothetical protein
MSNTTIQLRKSGQTGNTPADLAHGELAINYADGKLFYKNGVGIKSIENQKTFSTVNANNSLIIASSPTDILNIVPGNNITISTNTTSKTVTLNVRNNLNVETLNVRSTSWFSGDLIVSNGAGLGGSKEGGEIKLATATQDSSLAPGTVSIDIYENKLRIFETGGANRGVFIDLANGAASGVGTNLISVGAASGVSSIGGAIGAISNNQVLSFVQAVSSTAGITFDYVATANNGQGTNFKVGDDAWIGDTNLANAIRIKGQQDETQGYILFGNNDGKLLGRSGSGALTYDANTIWNAGNDGPGSGLDADTLDGLQASSFANNTFTQAAFNSANAGVTLATAAYAQANSASSNTVYLNEINTLQNTNITSVNTFAASAFNSANAGVTLATAGYNQANNASSNTVYLQSINDLQNTNITSVNTFAGSAFNSANAGVALATSAYAEANNASGNTVALQAQMTTTNTNIGYTDTLATAAYGKANAEGAINNTQNNWIASTNTFAQAAYNTANLKFNTTGGTITGNVTIQNNLVVEGNLIVIGNSTTITTNDLSITDSLIFLANGNITTDALDIGFVGNYGGLSGEEHTGFFRDPVQKEWILFEGYTDQILSNTLINIANPTFAYANLYANVVKANLISTRATVNGLDVYNTMTNAWNSANAGVTLATAAYDKANGAVQTGFTTIAANSVNITPTSNADTLTITAGNNISITACTTTKTIIINSTASGGGGGSGALTYDTAPPASGNTVGDRWVDSNDGTLYTYINDGNSSQWVDFSTAATPASVGGGTANAILYQAGVGNTTFTSVGSQGQLLTAGVAGVPIWAAQTALSIANTQITGLITNAQLAGPLGVTVTDETANSSTFYPLFSDIISGTLAIADVSSTKLTYVPSTGTLSSTVITSTSDEKLKTNISTIQDPINIIKQLRGVEYNWKDNGQKSMGVIAQEVEKILPYLVSENENSKSVMYSNMVGLLIEAIKEQQKQIDELRGKLNAD